MHISGSAGRKLPPEILSRIVRCLRIEVDVLDTPFEQWVVTDSKVKKGLAACSLTCRYWSTSLRPILFSSLILRDASDVERLMEILLSPISLWDPPHRYITNVCIEADGSQQQPWLHHVYKVWRCISAAGHQPYYRRFLHIRVAGREKEKPGMTDGQTHVIPFQSLPRSLPYTGLPIQHIILSDLRLRRSYDLLRLVREFPSLIQCSFRRISFVETQSSHPTLPILRRSKKSWSFRAIVSECGGDSKPESQLALAAAAVFAPQLFGLNEHTWSTAFSAAAFLCPPEHSAVDVQISAFHGRPGKQCIIRTTEAAQIETDGNYRFVHIASVLYVSLITTGNKASPPTSIASWTLNLQEASLETIQAMRWDEFQEALMSLDHSPVFSIISLNKDVIRWILSAVAQSTILARFLDSDKLQISWSGSDIRILQRDILSVPSEYVVDDLTLTLDPLQRFEFMLCKTDIDKNNYLRNLLDTRKHSTSLSKEAAN